MTPDTPHGTWIETDVPPRLDALGWSRWHQRVVLALGILIVRRHVPESPRWLLTHGYVKAARETVREIECEVHHGDVPKRETRTIRFKVVGRVGMRQLLHALLVRYPKRTVLGASLLVAQAFFYNAIFFSYALVLTKFHGVRADRAGLYMIPFAVGNFLGPVTLGHLFDRWGRRNMISLTYALAGVLLLATGGLFLGGMLNAYTQTIAWTATFFVASSAASSAYLTVSELFPIELRGLVIGVFYAFATLISASAPALFGAIIDTGAPGQLFTGYALAATLMIAAAGVEWVYGVNAERRPLEEMTSHQSA